jgi:hypothetical protein
MSGYDLPRELQVDADGPVRVVRLNRPQQLNATNDALRSTRRPRCPRSTGPIRLGRR